jgi:hypothetical protein
VNRGAELWPPDLLFAARVGYLRSITLPEAFP